MGMDNGSFKDTLRSFLYLRCMRILLFCLLLTTVHVGHAQDSLKWISLGFNAQAYKGDLGNNYSKWSGAAYASLQFKIDKKWNGTVNLVVGEVAGQDLQPEFNVPPESGRQPNTYFRTSLVAAYYQVQWNFLLKERFRVFVGQGIGLLRYNTKDSEGMALSSQANTRAANESAGNIALMLPSSIGSVYKFRNNFGVGYKISLLNTATDYMDNISQLARSTGGDNILAHQVSFMIPVHF